jgi:DNA polymerase IIIc chi subunit
MSTDNKPRISADDYKSYAVRFVDQRFMSIEIAAESPEHAEAIAEWLWTHDRCNRLFHENMREPFEAAFVEEVQP